MIFASDKANDRLSSSATLQAKYQSLSATGPWPSILGTRFLCSRMADIDGDGCDEIIALSPACAGLVSANLGVLSYFDASALSDQYEPGESAQLVATGVLPYDPSQQVFPAAIRGSGLTDLMIFDGAGKSITLYAWCGTGLQNIWATAPNVYGGTDSATTWPLASGDTFFLGDIDGDGLDEIIAFQSPNLAVMKWVNNSDIRVIWNASSQGVPGIPGYSAWPPNAADRFLVGDLDGDGKAEILVYDGNETIGLLRWDAASGGLLYFSNTVQKVSAGAVGAADWQINSADTYQLADVNGDGKAEVVAYNGTALSIAAFGFDSSNLRVIGGNTGTIPSEVGPAWTLTLVSQIYSGRFQTSGIDDLMVFAPYQFFGIAIRPSIGLFTWQSDGTNPPGWTAYCVDFTSLTADGPTWSLSSTNTFAVADVDGDGFAEIVAQDDTTSTLAYLSWSGSVLGPAWSCSTSTGGQSPLPGWGAGIIANAPQLTFQPWPNANQQSIYTQLSKSLTADSAETDDIRSYYVSSVNNLSTYASDVSSAIAGLTQTTPMYYYDWMKGFGSDDLNAVLNAVYIEMLAVGNVWQFNTNIEGMLNAVLKQQQTDLTTVGNNLDIGGSNSGAYWAGQIVDAALWGIAAAPLGPEAQVLCAVAASLFGSALGQVNGQSAAQVAYDDLNNTLSTYCTSSINTIEQLLYNETTGEGVLTDPIRLPLLGRFLVKQGGWTTDVNTQVAESSSNFNKITFYKQLTNQVYQIYQFNNLVDPDLSRFKIGFDPPDNVQVATTNPTGTTFYCMCQNPFSFDTIYPSETLLSDLVSLGWPLDAILTGTSTLNLSITDASNDGDGINIRCTMYTTNNSGTDAWITLYSGWDEISDITAQMLNAGASLSWVGSFSWSNTYKIRAEMQIGTGNYPNVTIDVWPHQSFGGSGEGFAFSLGQDGGGWSWQKLN